MTLHKRRVNYRLYPKPEQAEALLGMLKKHQLLYNAALEQRITAYRKQGVSLSYYQQAKELTELRAELPVPKGHQKFRELNAQSSQNTLKRMDRAFQHFYRRYKAGVEKAGFPRFKSFARYPGWGYNTHGDGWRLSTEEAQRYLKLSGVGHIRMRGKARTLGKAKTLDILYKQGKWYASVVFECEPERKQNAVTSAIGLDWGVENFATLAHDNNEYTRIENKRHLRSELNQLKQLQRDCSRKKRGSRNWSKAKQKIVALHAKIARKRHEFLHQTSAQIVKENSVIAVEKLNIKGMTASGGNRKKGLNREVLRAPVVGVGTSRTNGDSIATAPGAFHKMLKYLCPPGCKVEETGTRYIEVPTRKLKPSQTCSGCGKQQKKPLEQRIHECPCGIQLSRDENAARVILNWALESIKGRGSALCGEIALAVSAKHETPAMLCGRHP